MIARGRIAEVRDRAICIELHGERVWMRGDWNRGLLGAAVLVTFDGDRPVSWRRA